MRWYIKIVRTVVVVAAVSIVSSMLTIGTTALVVDGYIQTAIQQLNVPIKREPMTAATLWHSLWKGQSASSGQNVVPSSSSLGESHEVLPSGTNDSNGEVKQDDESTPQTNPAPDDALPVWGSVTEEAGSASQQEEVIVKPETWTESKDQLPADAKDEIFSTLLQKLPQEDWQRLSTLMEGGLTSAELSEVEQILAKHLNDEEYEKMRGILAGDDKTTSEAGIPDQGEGGSSVSPDQTP